MELFIESPQRVRERLERERRALDEQLARAAELLDLDEPDMGEQAPDMGRRAMSGTNERAERAVPGAASSAAEAYQAERTYDRRRARRRKAGHALRLLGIVVAVPLVVVAVFFASYALTYILNGASPEEVARALLELMGRIKTVVTQAFSSITA